MDHEAKKIEQGAEDAWQRFSALAPPEQRTSAFEECFKAGFLAGVGWTSESLAQTFWGRQGEPS